MADNKNETPKADLPKKTAAPAAKAAPESEIKAPEGYVLVNWPGGRRIDAGTFGIIDLGTMTPKRAGQLVARKFKFLAKK